jgi:AcrR family transcriptional regulator
MATADDLTARARIRDAALRQFGEQGFERTTIRGIAATAGVSPGLVRHHFGSKAALRDAVDEHVLTEIRRINDEVRKGIAANGEFSEDAITRAAIRPFQGYLARAMVDGSAIISAFFDQIVGLTEEWLGDAEELTDNEFFADRRTRAAVLSAMAMGVPLLREQLSRVLGVDSFSPEGERMVSMALLDIYSHVLITPELAAAARKAFDSYGGGDHE